MRLERLEVVDFRNHDSAEVELQAGVSVLDVSPRQMTAWPRSNGSRPMRDPTR